MPYDLDDPRLTAYALGELEDDDGQRTAIDAALAEDEEARRFVAEVRALGALLTDELRAESGPSLDDAQRQAIEACLDSGTSTEPEARIVPWFRRARWYPLALAASLLVATGLLALTASVYRSGPQAEFAAAKRALAPEATTSETPSAVAAPASPKVELALNERENYSRFESAREPSFAEAHGSPTPASSPADEAPALNFSLTPSMDEAAGPPSGVSGGYPGAEGLDAMSGLAEEFGRAQPAATREGAELGGARHDGLAATAGSEPTGSASGRQAGPGRAGQGQPGQQAGAPVELGRMMPHSKKRDLAMEGQDRQDFFEQKAAESGERSTLSARDRSLAFGAMPQAGQAAEESGRRLADSERPARRESATTAAPAVAPPPPPPPAGTKPAPARGIQLHALESEAKKQPGNSTAVPAQNQPVADLQPAPPVAAGAELAAVPNQVRQRFEELPRAVRGAQSDSRSSPGNDKPAEAPILARAPAREARRLQEQAVTLQEREMGRQLRAARQAAGQPGQNQNRFAPIRDNPFVSVAAEPLSTFSIDVDTASYAIVRRYLLDQDLLPPPDAVRIEELVNSFRYDYPEPGGTDAPFYVDVEVIRCPWNAEHRLARIGLQGRSLDLEKRPPANLVFLLDVSGSMNQPDKLPLLKRGMTMLAGQLREGDRVAIVTYANEARLALDSTSAERRREIVAAIDALAASGSTNGGAGLELAYDIAARNFIPDGTNRVILATDGDFNVGLTDDDALVRLIRQKAGAKVFLSVLGFGLDNLQDARLKDLAGKGDGNYHYIDDEAEARRVLVEEMAGTLVTIARDVKIQVDFNPAKVAAYRLLGYEDRLLAPQDFRDDTKDAGEIGAGHSVTALYELVPAGKEGNVPLAEPSEFARPAEPAKPEADESFVVKLRSQPPEGGESVLRRTPVVDDGRDVAAASADTRFAAAVAAFGMILRDSPHMGNATLDAVLELAESSLGDDPDGARAGFLELVRKARELRGE